MSIKKRRFVRTAGKGATTSASSTSHASPPPGSRDDNSRLVLLGLGFFFKLPLDPTLIGRSSVDPFEPCDKARTDSKTIHSRWIVDHRLDGEEKHVLLQQARKSGFPGQAGIRSGGSCGVELTSAAVGSSLPPNHPVGDFANSASTIVKTCKHEISHDHLKDRSVRTEFVMIS